MLEQLVKDLEENGDSRHLRHLEGYGNRAATGVSQLESEAFYKGECSTVGCPKLKEVRSF